MLSISFFGSNVFANIKLSSELSCPGNINVSFGSDFSLLML